MRSVDDDTFTINARRDVKHGLRFTLDYFSQSRALQERALEILQFKLDVLWTMLDAMWTAHVDGKPPYFNCASVGSGG